MKKIVMLLVMLLTLGLSTVCSAASGKILDAEEAIVAKFMEGNYKAISPSISAEMQKNFTETAYANFHSQLATDFGKVTTNKLRVVEKFDDADVLTYQIIAEKVPAARFVYVFVLNGEKPLLNDLKVLLPKPQQEAAGK